MYFLIWQCCCSIYPIRQSVSQWPGNLSRHLGRLLLWTPIVCSRKCVFRREEKRES